MNDFPESVRTDGELMTDDQLRESIKSSYEEGMGFHESLNRHPGGCPTAEWTAILASYAQQAQGRDG